MKVWHFVKGGSVSSIHPPLDDLTFLLKDVALTATPFRKGREGDTAATCTDVQKIHQQLNYTNTAISTIATQLNHVATRLENPSPTPSSATQTETYANTVSKPFFKVEGVPRKDQEHFSESFSNGSLLKQISEQIKALDSQIPSTSCIDKTCSQIPQDSSSDTEDEENTNNNNISESEEDTLNVITKLLKRNKI